MDAIATGWLQRVESGKKQNFFVSLKDLFMLVWSDQPHTDYGKSFDKLKSRIYLPTAKLLAQAEESATGDSTASNTIVIETEDKTVTFTAPAYLPSGDKDYMRWWRAVLKFAIKRAQGFEKYKPTEGWMMKKGGKTHNVQNWKKRYFSLCGNMLSYFSSDEIHHSEMKHLKGFIEASQIVELDDMDEGLGEHGFVFRVATSTGREYYLSPPDAETKKIWIKAIKKTIRHMAQGHIPISLHKTEDVVRYQELRMTVNSRIEWKFCVLTNWTLRIYHQSMVAKAETIVGHWGEKLLHVVPLTGSTFESSFDNFGIIDITGNSYTFNAKTADDLGTWIDTITDRLRAITTQVIQAGETIRFRSLTSIESSTGNTPPTMGATFCIITVDKSYFRLEIVGQRIMLVDLATVKLPEYENGAISFAYSGTPSGSISFRCGNSITRGVFEALFVAWNQAKKDRATGASPRSPKKKAPMTKSKSLVLDKKPIAKNRFDELPPSLGEIPASRSSSASLAMSASISPKEERKAKRPAETAK